MGDMSNKIVTFSVIKSTFICWFLAHPCFPGLPSCQHPCCCFHISGCRSFIRWPDSVIHRVTQYSSLYALTWAPLLSHDALPVPPLQCPHNVPLLPPFFGAAKALRLSWDNVALVQVPSHAATFSHRFVISQSRLASTQVAIRLAALNIFAWRACHVPSNTLPRMGVSIHPTSPKLPSLSEAWWIQFRSIQFLFIYNTFPSLAALKHLKISQRCYKVNWQVKLTKSRYSFNLKTQSGRGVSQKM